MIDLENIDCAYEVDRTDEVLFKVPSQVGGIEELKIAKGYEQNDTVCVFGEVLFFWPVLIADVNCGRGASKR